MSGSASERVAVVTASARSLPALMYSMDAGIVAKAYLYLPREEIGQSRPCATIENVHHINTSHYFEKLAGHMHRRTKGPRAHVDLARATFGIGDKLWDGFGGERRMHHHHVGDDNNAGDRRDVADEIEVEFVIECRVERVEGTDYEQGVAVCRRAHDRLGCDVAAGSRTVVDDERLTKPLREPLTYQTRYDVRTASGREANNDAHRPRRVGLRPSEARDGRERGSARGQM